MLIFCPTDLDEGSGSGADNESKIFSPRVDLECIQILYTHAIFSFGTSPANCMYKLLTSNVLLCNHTPQNCIFGKSE